MPTFPEPSPRPYLVAASLFVRESGSPVIQASNISFVEACVKPLFRLVLIGRTTP